MEHNYICPKCNNKLYISPIARRLFAFLKEKDIQVDLEKCYEYKKRNFLHFDIAIPSLKLNIEIDGLEHYEKDNASKDLLREFYSYKKRYYTLHLSNELVEKRTEWVANKIKEFCIATEKMIEEDEEFMETSFFEDFDEDPDFSFHGKF